ncbi:MAG: hypothetical protein H6700_11130 [Myxococcales bacterium]|nr:hypothetical protein [Myxococcales bacterium]
MFEVYTIMMMITGALLVPPPIRSRKQGRRLFVGVVVMLAVWSLVALGEVIIMRLTYPSDPATVVQLAAFGGWLIFAGRHLRARRREWLGSDGAP